MTHNLSWPFWSGQLLVLCLVIWAATCVPTMMKLRSPTQRLPERKIDRHMTRVTKTSGGLLIGSAVEMYLLMGFAAGSVTTIIGIGFLNVAAGEIVDLYLSERRP